MSAGPADPNLLAPASEGEGGGMFYGVAVLRACALAGGNQLFAALELLSQICAALPDKSFVTYAVPWIRSYSAEIGPGEGQFPAVGVLKCLLPLLSETTGRLELWPSEAAFLEPWGLILEAAWRHAWLAQCPPPLLLAFSSLLSRLASFARVAVEMAHHSVAHDPSFTAGISLALAQRAVGDFDASLATLEDLTSRFPGNAVTKAELGRLWWTRGNLEEALRCVEDASFDTDPQLRLGRLYLRHKVHREWAGADLARRMGQDMTPLDMSLADRPLIGAVLPTADPAIAHLREMLIGAIPTPDFSAAPLEVAVPEWPAPSCSLCFAAVFGRERLPLENIRYVVPDDQQPAVLPSVGAVAGGDFQLWVPGASAGGWVPGLPPPPVAVANAVLAICKAGFYLPVWYRKAAALASSLFLAGVLPAEIAAAMVHPPERPAETASPDSIAPWAWLQHCQMAAALLLAHFGDPAQPWLESPRRHALLCLLRGPPDWGTTAAVVALTELALQNPPFLPDIRATLLQLLLQTGPVGPACCFRAPLVMCILRFPDLRPDMREQLRRLI